MFDEVPLKFNLPTQHSRQACFLPMTYKAFRLSLQAQEARGMSIYVAKEQSDCRTFKLHVERRGGFKRTKASHQANGTFNILVARSGALVHDTTKVSSRDRFRMHVKTWSQLTSVHLL